jgi:hypothetical protein
MANGLGGLNGHLAMPSADGVFNREPGHVWNLSTEEGNALEVKKILKIVEQEQNAKVRGSFKKILVQVGVGGVGWGVF